jgi:YVTN family beta-propeller protein
MAVTAGVVAVVAPNASAVDSTTYLEGVTSGGDVAAGGGKIFVAGNDRIVVADNQGALMGAVTGLSGVVGRLAVTPDGTRLYAAQSGSNQVVEIDTAALTVTRRIDLAGYPCPSNVSVSGSRLWVGYGCAPTWDGGIVSVDLSAMAPDPVRVATGLYGPPLVAAAGGALVAGELGISPGSLRVYDVTTTPVTLRGVIDGYTNYLGYLNDLAITPDGSMAISAFEDPYVFAGWDTTSLTKVRTYGAEPTFEGYPQAVAISPDGAYIAGARASGRLTMTGPDVALYDTATAAKTYTYDNPVGELLQGSLAFSGTDLFGVLAEPNNGPRHLWRVHGATLPAAALTLSAPSAATALEPLTMTGRLTLPDGSGPGTQPLVVTRRLPDGTSAKIAGATTAPDGTFTITDTPPVGGAIGYDVLWDGSATFRWASASATVTVAKHPSSLTLSGPATGVAGKQLRFSGAVNPGGPAPRPGSAVTVQRTVSNRHGIITTTLPAVTLADDGSFSFVDAPIEGGQYIYTAQWPGDDTFLPAQASHTMTVRGALG